ncbi:hypothetical protein [Thioclava sp. GXIMD2076]|uniref:hypothetical protein n=1 Tax=unclassified Thioclava TaxID=2621713 RepID=UPI0030CE6A8E
MVELRETLAPPCRENAPVCKSTHRAEESSGSASIALLPRRTADLEAARQLFGLVAAAGPGHIEHPRSGHVTGAAFHVFGMDREETPTDPWLDRLHRRFDPVVFEERALGMNIDRGNAADAGGTSSAKLTPFWV